MAIRYCDFNLNGELFLTPLGEFNSNIKLYEHMPMPEHKALKLHFQQIDIARQALAQEQVEESDDIFFDFGEDDFNDNPTYFEKLFESYSAWQQNKAVQSSTSGADGVKTSDVVEPLKGEAQASSSLSQGSEA